MTERSGTAENARVFGPVRRGDPLLAVLLIALAGLVVGVFWGMAPDFPTVRQGTLFAFLLAGCLAAGGVAALFYTPHRAEVLVTPDGLSLSARGKCPIAPVTLAWAEIAHIVYHAERYAPFGYIEITCGAGAERPGRRLRLHSLGLATRFPVVMAAIADQAKAGGWRMIGPRPAHVGNWFDGMNWRFAPQDAPDA